MRNADVRGKKILSQASTLAADIKAGGPRNSRLDANDSGHPPKVRGPAKISEVCLKLAYGTLNLGATRHKQRPMLKSLGILCLSARLLVFESRNAPDLETQHQFLPTILFAPTQLDCEHA